MNLRTDRKKERQTSRQMVRKTVKHTEIFSDTMQTDIRQTGGRKERERGRSKEKQIQTRQTDPTHYLTVMCRTIARQTQKSSQTVFTKFASDRFGDLFNVRHVHGYVN